MNYLEREYEFIEIKNEAFGGYIKMPVFMTKLMIKASVKKIRAAMGGKSVDISKRKISFEDKTILGYKSDMRVRIYTPEGDKKRPFMTFIHGGGWIGGSIEAVHHYCMAVADRADAIVMSVDYHLAPEARYPEGLEDCYKAMKWAIDNNKELNIDVNNVTVSGDSAGGNYSAVISIMAKERKDIKIHNQILLYPATDLTEMLASGASKQEAAFGQAILEMYLKDMSKVNDIYVSPMLSKDFSDLPDALLVVGDLDFLKESTLKYAKKLEEFGNVVNFSLYKNTRHAFIDNTGNCKQAEDLVNEVVEFINAKAIG